MKRLLALVILFALLALGCAGTPLARDDSLQQEVQDLRALVVELQRKAAVSEVELARLRQQVADLEARQGGGRTSVLPGSAYAPTAPQKIARSPLPVAKPPAHGPARPPAAAAAPPPHGIEESDLDVPPPAAPPPAARVPPPTKAPPPHTESAAEGGSAAATQALYDRGYALLHQGRYVDAETSFQRFLQANPKHELADNAQYWIGECRYSRGDLRGALAAFRETVQKYPEGNKVPDALLKAGQCLEGLRDIEGARVTYREIADRFPGTAAAAAAEERRAKLP